MGLNEAFGMGGTPISRGLCLRPVVRNVLQQQTTKQKKAPGNIFFPGAFLQKQKLTVRFLFLLSLTSCPVYISGTGLREHLADPFVQKHGRNGDQHAF